MLFSNLSQVVNKNCPPGFRTRYTSSNAFCLSGTNIYPKQQTTRSILLSLKGSSCASIICQSISRWLNLFLATVNIFSLISEAISFVEGGIDSRIWRVTRPVPAAISNTIEFGVGLIRFATSMAYGSKYNGPKN
ncbi:hypothetical protein D3C80_1604210 [compost metagenome]